jgi:hypothetical protein
MPTSRSLPPGRLAALVFGAGLLTSALLAWRMEVENRNRDRLRFESRFTELERIASRRLYQLEFAPRTAGALWAVKRGQVDRAEFAAYFRDHDLLAELPGALGIGFVRRVPRAALEDFVAATRADQAPEFKVKTLGDAAELHVVEFIEPAEPNRAALGLDIGTALGRSEKRVHGELELPRAPFGRCQGSGRVVLGTGKDSKADGVALPQRRQGGVHRNAPGQRHRRCRRQAHDIGFDVVVSLQEPGDRRVVGPTFAWTFKRPKLRASPTR